MAEQVRRSDILSQIEQFFKRGPVEWILRCVLGGLFIVAALPKISDPMALARIIDGYAILPDSFIDPMAHILPWFEISAGVSLVLGIFPRIGLYAINSLLAVFIVAITINIMRGHQFDCGCFSVAGHQTNPLSAFWLLLRDCVMVFVGLFLLEAPVRLFTIYDPDQT